VQGRKQKLIIMGVDGVVFVYMACFVCVAAGGVPSSLCVVVALLFFDVYV